MTPDERRVRATCAIMLLCGLTIVVLVLWMAAGCGCSGGVTHSIGVKVGPVEVEYVFAPGTVYDEDEKQDRARELYDNDGE